MDNIINMKTFLITARVGSFSKAARELETATSVVAKRIDQLEHLLRTKLVTRTTRNIALTDAGKKCVSRFTELVNLHDLTIEGIRHINVVEEGHLRIKAPTSLNEMWLGNIINQFITSNPHISVDLELMDRPVNPLVEGFDISISALPQIFPGVREQILCTLKQVVCASPSFIKNNAGLNHPGDLAQIDCLVFEPIGNAWSFTENSQNFKVNIKPKITSNSAVFLRESALAGHGVARLSHYIVSEGLLTGRLLPLFETYMPPHLTLKAAYPVKHIDSPVVRTFLQWLERSISHTPLK